MRLEYSLLEVTCKRTTVWRSGTNCAVSGRGGSPVVDVSEKPFTSGGSPKRKANIQILGDHSRMLDTHLYQVADMQAINF